MVRHRLPDFSVESLYDTLIHRPKPAQYVVGLSGGCDSIVLLHALKCLRPALGVRVSAIHVNHQLQREASDWQKFCEETCRQWGVSLYSEVVESPVSNGKGLEAAARDARYRVFRERLREDDVLLLAQHQDDQVETVLLNLAKGAGIDGLSGMPITRPLGRSQLFRPLLGVSRAALEHYAKQNDLAWIEDPSNRDESFDRNFIRQSVLPLLEQRFTRVKSSIARTSELCRSVSARHSAEAAEVLANIQDTAGRMPIQSLVDLQPDVRNNVLRRWCAQVGFVPTRQQLYTVVNEVILAEKGATPCLVVGRFALRREMGFLDLDQRKKSPDVEQLAYEWDLLQPLDLKPLGLWLEPQAILPYLSAQAAENGVTVRFRSGGERFRPVGSQHGRPLKDLFQKWGIPVSQRPVVPLVYHKDELILIYGYGVAGPA